jgi:predicted amidohydrolase
MILKVACIQTNAGPEIGGNLKQIEPFIRLACERGAQLIALPENVSMMVRGRENTVARAKSEAEHPAIPFFKRMAKETGAWILGGSLAIALGHEKLANRSYLFSPKGEIAAAYDKIHMFDADVGADERYRESETYRGGNRAVTGETPWGKIGLTICYDVRFPHLYRVLAKAGAVVIAAPAAFTVPTGKLHWHVLLRARAIETGAFILAPAQCGTHDGGRRTYGHSLIIDPLGQIITEAGEEPGIIMADLDLDKVTEARRMLPSLTHDCEFEKAC